MLEILQSRAEDGAFVTRGDCCCTPGVARVFTFVFNTNSEGAVSIKFKKFNSFILS